MAISLPLSLHTARSFSSIGTLFGIWLVLVAATLAWDISGLDMAVMQALGTPEGFPLKDNWWLSMVLHERLRLASQWLFVAMLVWAACAPKGKSLPRRERWLLVGLVLLSLLAVNLIKSTSRTSCPWDLQAFGGSASYVSHWMFGVGDGGSGRCFPGGHASSAFAFFALCLPWLSPTSGTSRVRATGWRWFALIMVMGIVAGVTQTLRGAHYPSHMMWTLVICAGVSMASWRLGQRWLLPRGVLTQAGKA